MRSGQEKEHRVQVQVEKDKGYMVTGQLKCHVETSQSRAHLGVQTLNSAAVDLGLRFSMPRIWTHSCYSWHES